METKLIDLVGDGAAQNISCGFIPDKVEIWNSTDGDKYWLWFRRRALPFTSMDATLATGTQIYGVTSGAKAIVREVLISSGTIAAGDAAGFIIFDEDTKTGTFETETLGTMSNGVSTDADVASVVVDVGSSGSIDTESATETGNAAITAYTGSTTAAPGFTIGSTISEEAKWLRCQAYRGING